MKLRPVLWLLIGVQALLLAFELWSHYDYAINKTALSLTNIIMVGGILWFDGWLRRHKASLMVATVLLAMAAVWLDAIGNFQHFYTHLWWWDHLTHAFGGMAVTAVFINLYLAWVRVGKVKMTRWHAAWLGFAWGQFGGAAYEISEYLGDFWFHTHRVGAGFDTSRDLTFNLVGGLLAVLVSQPWKRRRKS